MRNLRKAALVASMVGSVSMLGAGAASAQGNGGETPSTVIIKCVQNVGDNTSTPEQTGLVNISGPLLIGGNADSSANQQVCGLHNEHIHNTAGDSEGGLGGVVGDILGG